MKVKRLPAIFVILFTIPPVRSAPIPMYSSIKRRSFLYGLVFSALMLALSAASASAKKIAGLYQSPSDFRVSKTSSPLPHDAPAALEERLRPFLEQRLNGSTLTGISCPSESDLLLLARIRNQLSPDFFALYKTALTIPAGFVMHASPGGHFEIYFTAATGLPDAVSKVDTIGYGTGATWRPRTHSPNGIPDYVDEVAWALDSSWSMEIDKFGFIPPMPEKDAQHTSSKYRVVVRNLGQGDYGYTWCGDHPAGSSQGYTSSIEIRNDWSGPVWNQLGYTAHPEYGIRVTCAHEFFHAIQYSMAWDVQNSSVLDDFPIGWLEGTGVLMEELAFDSINDYVQYSTSYFKSPSMTFFGNDYGPTLYANALLAKYLVEQAPANGRIDLIKRPFFTNFAAMTPFHSNLRTVSLATGMPWVNILNGFHAGSYYTGARAITNVFLSDAAILDTWAFATDILPASDSLKKKVPPHGMGTFSFAPPAGRNDAVYISIHGETSPTDTIPAPLWAAHCIVRKTGRPDSTFPLTFSVQNQAQCVLADKSSINSLSLIVTNGHPAIARNVTVSLRSADQQVFKNEVPFAHRQVFTVTYSGQSLVFRGQGIQEICVFDIHGKQLADSRSFQKSLAGNLWTTLKQQTCAAIPGCRIAEITYVEPESGRHRRSLMRIPIMP